MSPTPHDRRCLAVLHALVAHHGAQHWWAHQNRLYDWVATILIQQTTQANAEKALANLGEDISASGLHTVALDELERRIRSAGFYKQKAQYLKNLMAWFARYGFGHQRAFAVDVVSRAACCALRDSLGNSSPKGVVAVLDGEAICAVPDFAESACCVVAPVSFPACAGFLDEVTQRVVAGAGLFGLALLRGGVFVERPGVLQQLVGFVVGPRSGLVGAAQAVACSVVNT